MAAGTIYMGANGYVGLKTESTPGTPATPDVFAPVDSFSFEQQVATVQPPTLLSISGFNPMAPLKVSTGAAGRLRGPLTYDNFGILWNAALGADSTTGAGPYTHTYTTDSAVLPSLTAEYFPSGNLAEEVTLSGAMVNTMTIDIPKGGIATIEADFIAMTATDYASGTARTAPTNTRYILGAQTTVTIGGTDHSDAVDNIRLVIANNVETRTSIGSFSPRAVQHVHTRTVTLEMTIQCEATYYRALVDDYLAQTARAVVVTATNSSESLTATLAVCYLTTEPTISVDGPGPLTARLVYQVLPDETPTQVASVAVVNDESSSTGGG